jgi:hypothetical protein
MRDLSAFAAEVVAVVGSRAIEASDAKPGVGLEPADVANPLARGARPDP